MTTWDKLKLDRQTETPLTVTTDRKENIKEGRPLGGFLFSANAQQAHLQVMRFWLWKKIQPKAAWPSANLQKSLLLPTLFKQQI